MNNKVQVISRRTAALSRREFLARSIAAAAAPYVITSFSLTARGAGRPAPSNRITVGAIGVGGRGTGDMGSFLSFKEVQVLAACDVNKGHRDNAKQIVDGKYGDAACHACNDFREVIQRDDIDAIMIGTPDHWHASIAIAAMRAGKDVFSEKPETLTIREGREIANAVKRYGRVYSGGSQRVWEDYNWAHRVVRSGMIGEVKEAFVNVGGPSSLCTAPEEPVPPGLDWDLYLGPAPWAPFNKVRLNFRAWRDYSGGGMTDWGAHGFGGALFTCNLQDTGPVEVIPPNGKDVPYLTYRFANGIKMYHSGKYKSIAHFIGTQGEFEQIPAYKSMQSNLVIPNYKGHGGLIGDFLYCVRTRELPWRNIERAHHTLIVCHLGNIAYWLGRRIQWDPVKEEIIGDAEASRWLSRPKRAPWAMA